MVRTLKNKNRVTNLNVKVSLCYRNHHVMKKENLAHLTILQKPHKRFYFLIKLFKATALSSHLLLASIKKEIIHKGRKKSSNLAFSINFLSLKFHLRRYKVVFHTNTKKGEGWNYAVFTPMTLITPSTAAKRK